MASEYGIDPGSMGRGTVGPLVQKTDMIGGGDAVRDASLLLEVLARRHPFTGGSKRTALLAGIGAWLGRNSRPAAPPDPNSF
ncbi:hypothetical protein IBTHAUMO2_390012 [Nitrosopumilaceae archaeon]|nr:hypothetical protein [Nitrosopumilus sp.]CAI9831743.1 hypothetical protein IBTHAUMO2_390012 [Nitrosopumilaceae archaeon]MDA7944778.1 hypothetical protein [Nitrosopumilus sp.]MDA7954650.1 hypothetical protein [Nitrosopumilus sp.]MDA7973679.1 hypothetical protein [Nitrosopumilus sp.]